MCAAILGVARRRPLWALLLVILLSVTATVVVPRVASLARPASFAVVPLASIVGENPPRVNLCDGLHTAGVSTLSQKNELEDDDGSKKVIPKLIHALWKTKNLSTYRLQPPSPTQWEARYKPHGWKVYLWTDEDVREIIKQHYFWLLSQYDGYARNIQRADIARLVLLHRYGGLYVDLDAFPTCEMIPSSLLSGGMEVVALGSVVGRYATNHAILATPRAAFLDFSLHRAHDFDVSLALPYATVLHSTGPVFFTRMVDAFGEEGGGGAGHTVVVVSDADMRRYIAHHAGRSWLSWDGEFLNRMWDGGHLPTIALVAIAIVAACATLLACARKLKERGVSKRRAA